MLFVAITGLEKELGLQLVWEISFFAGFVFRNRPEKAKKEIGLSSKNLVSRFRFWPRARKGFLGKLFVFKIPPEKEVQKDTLFACFPGNSARKSQE